MLLVPLSAFNGFSQDFRANWQGSLLVPETGEYEFLVKTENATRLWINDKNRPLVDALVKSGNDTEYRGSANLLGGRAYPLRLELSRSKEKTASISLEWKLPRRAFEVIPRRNLLPGSDGLDAMRLAAKAGKFAVVFFHSLSRLARESVISMPILKELVYVHHVRIVSITDGVDSNQPGWELSATINSVMHENYLKELSANVLRGQVGTLMEGYSVGDHCFGFKSEAVPGSERRRRGAGAKPRMRYAVDPEAANWVRQIFFWFVVERRTIRWIAKQLTKHRVPKGRGSTKPGWHHQVVTRLLGNLKYIGVWPWGMLRGRRNPLTGQSLRDQRTPEEVEKWTRNLPELQIVDREIFDQAQELLRENRKRVKPGGGGKFSRHQKGHVQTAPQHLLAGLIVCGECGHTFYAGGSRAKYLFCPNNQRGTCTCRTTVSRALAEELILRPISKQLLSDTGWFDEVLHSTLASWRRQQAQLPDALASVETTISDLERRIRRLIDTLENDDSDSGEIRDASKSDVPSLKRSSRSVNGYVRPLMPYRLSLTLSG